MSNKNSHGLSAEDSTDAWIAVWNPSFQGIAIVNEDFTFRNANQKFCELLGVPLSELVGHKFQDITHPNIKRIDEQQASLIREGYIDHYYLPKTYLFEDGREVSVVLLVSRVPKRLDEDFKFFIKQIMLSETGELLTAIPEDVNKRKVFEDIFLFAKVYGPGLIIAGSFIAGIIKFILFGS